MTNQIDTIDDMADGDEDYAELEQLINPGKPVPDADVRRRNQTRGAIRGEHALRRPA